MSTEYSVMIRGEFEGAVENYALLKCAIDALRSASAVSAFETSFDSFDASVTGCIDELLKKHIDLLFSGVAMVEEKGRFRWMWEGYGDAFMVTLLQLFDLLGVVGLVGESHGDEEVYCCQVTEDSLECEYIGR